MKTFITAFLRRQPYSLYPERFFYDNRWVMISACLLLCIALIIRSSENLLHPALYVEDATHYFNIYYGGHRSFSFILQHPNGYFNIFNNLVAWLVAKTDIRIHALLYHLIAVIMGIATGSCLLFSGLFRNKPILLIAPLLLGLSGMNHIFYYVTLTFQMYSVVILLLCLMFFRWQYTLFLIIVLVPLMSLLIWSGPYSVLAIPTGLLMLLFFNDGLRYRNMSFIICCTIAYTISVRSSTIRLENTLDPNILLDMTNTLFQRIICMDMISSLKTWQEGAIIIALGLLLFFLRREREYIKISVILLSIVISSLAPLFLSIKIQLYQTVFPCHIYIGQFFWLVFVLYSLDTLISTLKNDNRFVHTVIVVAVVSFVYMDNIRHPDKGFVTPMPDVPAFLETIHEAEQLHLALKNEYIILTMDSIFPGFLQPLVRVGSIQPDSRRLRAHEVKLPSGTKFIVN